MLGRLRGTLTNNRLLTLHTTIVAISLYRTYVRAIPKYLLTTRAVCTLVIICLNENYGAINYYSFANLINYPYCVHSSVALL
jgi:hypothetical protein